MPVRTERRPEHVLLKSDTVKYCSACIYHSHYTPWPWNLNLQHYYGKRISSFLSALTIPKIVISTSVSHCWDHNSFSIKNFSQRLIQIRLNKGNIHYQTEKQKGSFLEGNIVWPLAHINLDIRILKGNLKTQTVCLKIETALPLQRYVHQMTAS